MAKRYIPIHTCWGCPKHGSRYINAAKEIMSFCPLTNSVIPDDIDDVLSNCPLPSTKPVDSEEEDET